MKKLTQVLAVEKDIKTRTNATMTEFHKIAQQATLLNGQHRTYVPKDTDGLQQPAQAQKVSYSAKDIFNTVRASLIELFDVTATKDYGNTRAKADVVVDGKKLLEGVPATHLLFLNKQLTDMRTLISKFTELDPAVDWTLDDNTGMYRSSEVKTHTTQKVQDTHVVVPATEFHPAQVATTVKDVVVGEWTTVRQSGALPSTRKKELLDRVQRLMDAVKVALAEANLEKVEEVRAGARIMDYIFGA